MARPIVTAPVSFAINRFDPDTHQYSINGRRAPSVTQVLQETQLIDFSRVPSDTVADAIARGTYVHQVMHAYLEDDFDLADCDPRFRGYLDSGIKYLAEAKMKPLRDEAGKAIAVEYRFWHFKRFFGGTIDYVGFDPDGVIAIVDFKTGAPSDVAAALQTAGYEIGVRDCLLPSLEPAYSYTGPIRRRAVKLHADGSPARVYPYTDPRDLGLFLAALSVTHYRWNAYRHEATIPV